MNAFPEQQLPPALIGAEFIVTMSSESTLKEELFLFAQAS